MACRWRPNRWHDDFGNKNLSTYPKHLQPSSISKIFITNTYICKLSFYLFSPMKSINKLIVVALSAILTYASIAAGSYCNDFDFSDKCKKHTQTSEYFIQSEINLFTIQRSEKNNISFLENCHSLYLRKLQNLGLDRNFAIEHTLSCLTFRYIQFSSKLTISTAIRNIIFPFHYFW